MMNAARNVFFPYRSSMQLGITRSLLYSSFQPTFVRQYSAALVSASLRKQLRNNHNCTVYPTFQQRYSSSITHPTGTSTETASRGREEVGNTSLQDAATTITTTAATAIPQTPKSDTPAYEITFTCKPCQTRSTHKISKQGYHKGTILITCPDCKNRHLICDHLNIFRDQSTTIEDILKEKGENIRHGALGAEGDIEFWDDGTTSERVASETLSQSPPIS